MACGLRGFGTGTDRSSMGGALMSAALLLALLAVELAGSSEGRSRGLTGGLGGEAVALLAVETPSVAFSGGAVIVKLCERWRESPASASPSSEEAECDRACRWPTAEVGGISEFFEGLPRSSGLRLCVERSAASGELWRALMPFSR